MRVGIDVGGTNTDAVLMNGSDVVAWVKAPTTMDVGEGIEAVLRSLIAESGVPTSRIQSVMIGTTHFTNALVECRGLLEVGVIRLASPSGEALKPKIGWPQSLRRAVGEHSFLVPGGYEFDGREIAPFDKTAVTQAAREIRARDLKAVAISSVFAPVNDHMENHAAEIVARENPGISISLSKDIGRLGFLERENAAIMNAALSQLSLHVVQSLEQAIRRLNIEAPFYISQNDGTLMSASYVARYPVLTIASGPTNSMRGAAYLSGLADAVVIDIGGTTSDVGVLQGGFPRESSVEADIGGVRTNFRMPDILAIGLGGGTRIHLNPANFTGPADQIGDIAIGPDSVGYRLTKDAFVFGGETLTVTDLAVARGQASIGDSNKAPRLSESVCDQLNEQIHLMLEDALDRVKTSPADVPVILVGGGNIIVNRKLRGASEIIRPALASVANAIGAAIAQVGAEVDKLFSYDSLGRDQALALAKGEAIRRVVEAGGIEATAKVIEIDEVAMSYLPGQTVRVRAKATGDLAFS
ncbi:hydantoinase/oxoprolinase family protein [Govanella unica]|uniref:Hydantoinase/oxoprolinase family protein n=1 Tax=Govanella unica TaxID=2975056 RepID=A0A9X3Z794_9PROT|nr:hydantoinase/oxoprolinase family protein [Govania unica]MDA5193833.1 hydantoinase/oxoprolinase family protein [Govania unica]